MPRRSKCRRVGCDPSHTYFKPRGIPMTECDEVVLQLDELEAMRLADMESLYHEDAATRMGVSRQTFDRILQRAHTTVAQALVNGKAIHIDGGNIMLNKRIFICSDCQHRWSLPFGTGRPDECPGCKSVNIHRAEEDRGAMDVGSGRSGGGMGAGRGGGKCRRRGGGG